MLMEAGKNQSGSLVSLLAISHNFTSTALIFPQSLENKGEKKNPWGMQIAHLVK